MGTVIKSINGHDLVIDKNDKTAIKFAMLFEGQCTIGPQEAIKKYGYTEQRYYQVLKEFEKTGSAGLINKKRGPVALTVRTKETINQIIRMRFLDPFASTEVIAQKLKQNGYSVSIRSVERTITEYGLQKKLIPSTLKKKKKK